MIRKKLTLKEKKKRKIKIEGLLLEYDVDRKALATRLNISYQVLNNWINGYTDWPKDKFEEAVKTIKYWNIY